MAEAHEAVAFSFTVGPEGKIENYLSQSLFIYLFLYIQVLMSMSVMMFSKLFFMLVYDPGNFVVVVH
jgi:hypothetical protein